MIESPSCVWLLYPVDFPDKNTGVGFHFLLQGNLPNPGIEPGSPALQADALTSELPWKCFQLCVTLCDSMDHSWPGSCAWHSPGKNTGVVCHSLLQEIFPTQESNPGLPHCRQILYCLSHQGSLQRANYKTKISNWDRCFPRYSYTFNELLLKCSSYLSKTKTLWL